MWRIRLTRLVGLDKIPLQKSTVFAHACIILYVYFNLFWNEGGRNIRMAWHSKPNALGQVSHSYTYVMPSCMMKRETSSIRWFYQLWTWHCNISLQYQWAVRWVANSTYFGCIRVRYGVHFELLWCPLYCFLHALQYCDCRTRTYEWYSTRVRRKALGQFWWIYFYSLPCPVYQIQLYIHIVSYRSYGATVHIEYEEAPRYILNTKKHHMPT